MSTWRRTKNRYAGAALSARVRRRFEQYWSHLSELTRAKIAERRGQPSPWNSLIAQKDFPSNLGPAVTSLKFDQANGEVAR